MFRSRGTPYIRYESQRHCIYFEGLRYKGQTVRNIEEALRGHLKSFPSLSRPTNQFPEADTGSANLTFENRLLLNILAIIPLFVEYWKLGCKVTCSPIDTAEAFDAPVFPDSPS